MFEIRLIERPVGVFTSNNAKERRNHDDFRQPNPENTPFTDVPKADAGQGSTA